MRTLVSFAALFLSIFLVQLGSGSLGPLDALAGTMRGFTTGEIGLLGSAHFAGFFIGCFLAPRFIGAIGHSRCFAAAAAIGATGALLHPVLEGPLYWAGLRVLTGIAVAGSYTVVESWLQAKSSNANRGRIYGVFRVIDLGGQITSQGLIAVLDPATYVAYNIIAVFFIICLLPLTLTRRMPPKTPAAPRLRIIKAMWLSPSAVAGIIVAGVTGSAFRMLGPVFGLQNGLDQGQIALFLSAAIVGGVAAQIPVGWMSDRTDRRNVLILLSVVAIVVCLLSSFAAGPGDAKVMYLIAFFFGASAYPIYSVAAAYANDYAEKDFIVELSASLMFFYSIGAIISPAISAVMIDWYGPGGLFFFMALTHLLLIAMTLYRKTRRRAGMRSTPYRYMPRTSMVLARLLGRSDDTGNAERAETDTAEPPFRREP